MKKKGIINAELSKCLASLGHKDSFMIADAGMPIPENVQIIDLAIIYGVPTFKEVMDAVVDEVYVESYVLANEIDENNVKLLSYIDNKLSGIPCEKVSHTELKKMTNSCKFVIRTGENTPYPNIILVSGCAF
ncbi:MAG: D-ribose pyranase [Eubacteriales bacterium]|nr:D-ribose pyranase [Eubacteriales bacterium]